MQHHLRPGCGQRRRRVAADDHARIGWPPSERAKVAADLLRVEVDRADDFNSRARQGQPRDPNPDRP